MKLHILTELQDGAWGGGNQFQKALRGYLQERDSYAEEIEKTDAVLANSHHWGEHLLEVFRLKRCNPGLIILHRVDGPVSVVRSMPCKLVVDQSIMGFNERFADGTIFQSMWSKGQCLALGMDASKPHVVIHNAPDPAIFYPPQERAPANRVRLVAGSWSTNERKGFDVYRHLDEHLDFSRYAFTFVGNSPVTFRNIQHKPPMSSEALADELRSHELFVHASHMESCSNSLIEAMNCGLVPVVRNNTSHPEIVSCGGLLFEGVDDVLSKIELAVLQQDDLRNTMRPPTLEDVGAAYLEFARRVREQKANTFTKPSWSDLASVWTGLHKIRLQSRWERLGNFAGRV